MALAAALAATCRKGDCILLSGDLGTGKTTFARGFIRSLGCQDEVVSPTFTLTQTYESPAGLSIWHYDLYRVEKQQDLDQLGLEEALDHGVALIEWPAIAASVVPKTALDIRLEHMPGDARQATLSGEAGVWKNRLEALA